MAGRKSLSQRLKRLLKQKGKKGISFLKQKGKKGIGRIKQKGKKFGKAMLPHVKKAINEVLEGEKNFKTAAGNVARKGLDILGEGRRVTGYKGRTLVGRVNQRPLRVYRSL